MRIISKKPLLLLFILGLIALVFFIVKNDINGKKNFVAPLGSEKFFKGVVYSPYYPGENGGDSLPDDGRYEEHLRLIKDLGANTVSVFPEKLPAGFFLALDNNDLSYVPIINIRLYDGTNQSDLLNEDYQKKVLKHVEEIIDYNYLVGRPNRLSYFVLGYEISPDQIAATNSLHRDINEFKGNFIFLEDRQPAEIALARLLDAAMSYESENYGERHLYAHIVFPANLNKVSFLPDFFDIIAVNLYPSYFYPDEEGFAAYLRFLASLSNKPIVISEFGASTALPGVNGSVPVYRDGSAKAAAELLSAAAAKIVAQSEIKGLFFFELMDEYWKNGEEIDDALLHNLNDAEEWFGLYEIGNGDGNYFLQEKTEIVSAVKDIFSGKGQLIKKD